MGSSSTTSSPATAEMPVQPRATCGDVQLCFSLGPPAVSTGAGVSVMSDTTGLQLNTDTHWIAGDKAFD